MGLDFNPADIQTMGVGIAAFLATVLMLFVFMSARKEKFGRALMYVLAAAAVWAWFGFLYESVPSLAVAREMRIVSVIGIVWINILEMNFALVYLREHISIEKWLQILWQVIYGAGMVLTGLLISDLVFETQFVVGKLFAPPQLALAPQAGPMMIAVVAYFVVTTAISGALLARTAKVGITEADRRQALILCLSITIGLALGGTRFLPWYGISFYPIVGDIGFPLFTFAALYAIQRYRVLNVQILVAQLLVIALWTLTFFRLLLDTTLQSAYPDIAVFAASLIIGIFVLRAVVVEMRAQKELTKLTVEQAKSEFVSVAAHQLRTPLSAVRWALNLLLSSMPPTDKNREIAVKAGKAADNMMYIINDLLNVSRLSEGHMAYDMAEGDLRDVAKTAVSVLSDAAGAKKIALTIVLPPGPLPATFDHDKMVMVVENLVDNAIKYTPEGGSVHVEVEDRGATAHIQVTDTGIGLTVEDRAHVFERFFRSTRAKHVVPDGSGLGLYIVRTIVTAHKGQVSLGPGPGKGAIATVDIPTSRHK